MPIRKVLRFFIVAAGAIAAAYPASADLLSDRDRTIYRKAFAAADKERWRHAERIAARASDSVLKKVLAWRRMRSAGSGLRFAEIAAFIAANPHWPELRLLRQRAEEAMDERTPDDRVIAWFADHPPVSANGAIRLIEALLRAGRKAEARAVARKGWIELDMGYRQERTYRTRFRKLLRRKDHLARLDRLLWDQRTTAARRQLRRVDRGHQALAGARLALMRREPGVDHAIARVPRSLLNDPGLLYERVRWRRRRGFDEAAIALLAKPPSRLERPAKWWKERRILTRRLLDKGDISRAYRLASAHRQTGGLPFAEAEWLSGWIALRFLRDEQVALRHFARMHERVRHPVSRARAAYWAGRAASSAGHAVAARKWFRRAARHATTFYGQLAAAQLPAENRPTLPPEPSPTADQKSRFKNKELVHAVHLLKAIERQDLVDPFIDRLAREASAPGEWVLVARLAKGVSRPDLAVRVSKRALRAGVILGACGYPSLAIDDFAPPDPALVHAVVRQESAFDPKAVSYRGALGLMQLMPSTAVKVARRLRLPYSQRRLVLDPAYNLALGRAYLAKLLEDYDGSAILAIAAYNAGPSRVRRWLQRYGPPGPSSHEAVDWIESIPLYETRNYVQRVLENLTVYRSRRDGMTLALSLVDRTVAPRYSVTP